MDRALRAEAVYRSTAPCSPDLFQGRELEPESRASGIGALAAAFRLQGPGHAGVLFSQGCGAG